MSSLWQVNFRFHISMCSTNGIAHYEIICWHMDSYCIILVIYTRINYTAQHQTYPNIETILYIMKPYVDMWNYTKQYKSYVDIWNHRSQYIQYADIWNNIEVNEAICQNEIILRNANQNSGQKHMRLYFALWNNMSTYETILHNIKHTGSISRYTKSYY